MREFRSKLRVLLIDDNADHLRGVKELISLESNYDVVGATTSAENFLQVTTLKIVFLGLAAFILGTTMGVLFGKIMCAVTKGKVNPLIGSAGVSAVPMAARVSNKVGQEYHPTNYLLMHAMGPNVAGVIGSAVVAGILLSMLGK